MKNRVSQCKSSKMHHPYSKNNSQSSKKPNPSSLTSSSPYATLMSSPSLCCMPKTRRSSKVFLFSLITSKGARLLISNHGCGTSIIIELAILNSNTFFKIFSCKMKENWSVEKGSIMPIMLLTMRKRKFLKKVILLTSKIL